ncbi:hypothetical protein HDU88_007133 [Geranomyces variabilis]|nr:hypothetical protein HDU88_007133 [Geranomyces variabilis]
MVDYEHFLTQLRKPEAAPLMTHFKGFLVRFNAERRPIMQHRRLVASFIHFIYGESLQNEIFSATSADEDLDNIREGWEKLVMMNIYDRVFGAAETDDLKMGAHLQRKIESFQWVQESHLDLPFSFQHTLEVAQAELLRVNGFRAPRDKLIILQNTSQIVVDLIGKVSSSTAGNDHLLPVLILTILRANPPNLIANIKYIMRFRNQAELEKGNNQFCVTNMMSAVSFIYNMSAKSLTLTPDEAARYTSGGGAAGSGSSSRQDTSGQSSTGQRSDPVAPQVSQLASKVYTSTSGWFNTLIKEAKIFGDTAAAKVDGFVNHVVGDSDEDDQQVQYNNNNHNASQAQQHKPPAAYPGRNQNNLHLDPRQGQPTAPWIMQPSPTLSLSPSEAHNASGAPPPVPARRPLQQFGPPGGNTGNPMSPTEQEDYEMQLAMALSLSTIEADKQRRQDEERERAEGALLDLSGDERVRDTVGDSDQALDSNNGVVDIPPVVITEAQNNHAGSNSPVREMEAAEGDADDVPLVKSQQKPSGTSLPHTPDQAGSDSSLI